MNIDEEISDGNWINSLTKQEAINPIKKAVRILKGFKNGSGILENKLKKGISGGSRLPKKNPIKLK